MAFGTKHYWASFINFDPIYKYDLYTPKAIKTIFLAQNPDLYWLLSWIKGYKPHKKKNIDKCHIWISFIKFDPTSKFRKTWFLLLTLVIWIDLTSRIQSKQPFWYYFFEEINFLNYPYVAFSKILPVMFLNMT